MMFNFSCAFSGCTFFDALCLMTYNMVRSIAVVAVG
jgi:hypothetical protein